jgi:hypothetical protein
LHTSWKFLNCIGNYSRSYIHFIYLFSNFLFGWPWIPNNLHALFLVVLKLNVKGTNPFPNVRICILGDVGLSWVLKLKLSSSSKIFKISYCLWTMQTLWSRPWGIPTILAILINKQSNLSYHGQFKGETPMMSIFFLFHIVLVFHFIEFTFTFSPITLHIIWKMIVHISKNFQDLLFICTLLNFQYISSNLLNKKENIALLRNILEESLSFLFFVTSSLSKWKQFDHLCEKKFAKN